MKIVKDRAELTDYRSQIRFGDADLSPRRLRFSIVGMLGFEIYADICKAHTPPSRFYTDAVIFDTLKRTAFAQSWQIVADVDAVKAPGNVYPAPYLAGAIDGPLLLTRDYDDLVHCLANVCIHLGNRVCEGA